MDQTNHHRDAAATMAESIELPAFSGYPLDMFAPIDMSQPDLQPPNTPLVRILRRGRAESEDGTIAWLHEARDEVSRHMAADFFAGSTQEWTFPADAEGWFYSFWHYPAHQCDLGCDAPAFVDVRAVRWLPADRVPTAERYLAGRPLKVGGGPRE